MSCRWDPYSSQEYLCSNFSVFQILPKEQGMKGWVKHRSGETLEKHLLPDREASIHSCVVSSGSRPDP